MLCVAHRLDLAPQTLHRSWSSLQTSSEIPIWLIGPHEFDITGIQQKTCCMKSLGKCDCSTLLSTGEYHVRISIKCGQIAKTPVKSDQKDWRSGKHDIKEKIGNSCIIQRRKQDRGRRLID